MIGVIDSSIDDSFYTPYSTSRSVDQTMPGVVINAQLASQIIDGAFPLRPLFWFLSEWQEILWIVIWSLAGGSTIAFINHPLYVVFASFSILCLLIGTSWFIFLQAGWVPFATPVIAFLLNGVFIFTYRIIRHYQISQLTIWIEERNKEELG